MFKNETRCKDFLFGVEGYYFDDFCAATAPKNSIQIGWNNVKNQAEFKQFNNSVSCDGQFTLVEAKPRTCVKVSYFSEILRFFVWKS